jgi:hypothetical protein
MDETKFEEMNLPYVKTGECLDCFSQKYFECPYCLTYRCRCDLKKCDKCNIYHCFIGDCGDITYFKTEQEKARDLWLEFEFKDYVGSRGKKILNCKKNVEMVKCTGCDFSTYPWFEYNYIALCAKCNNKYCGDHKKRCSECDKSYCHKHYDNIISCGCKRCKKCPNFLCVDCDVDRVVFGSCYDCEAYCRGNQNQS